jgi:predicted SPOUT superfamily RNA methylase MTH1
LSLPTNTNNPNKGLLRIHPEQKEDLQTEKVRNFIECAISEKIKVQEIHYKMQNEFGLTHMAQCHSARD